MTKLKLSKFEHPTRRTIRSNNNVGRSGRQQEKKSIRYVDSIRKAMTLNLQDLSRDVTDRTFWRSQ